MTTTGMRAEAPRTLAEPPPAELGPGGLSASIVSLTVASLLTVAVALPGALRAHRRTA